MAFDPGCLRHRVVIQSPERVIDAHGQPSIQYSAFAELSADVMSASGKEVVMRGQAQSVISLIVTIRHTPGITAAMRVVFNGAVYEIFEVKHDRTFKRFMTLKCVSTEVLS